MHSEGGFGLFRGDTAEKNWDAMFAKMDILKFRLDVVGNGVLNC